MKINFTYVLYILYAVLIVNFLHPLNENLVDISIGLAISINTVSAVFMFIGIIWTAVLLNKDLKPNQNDAIKINESKAYVHKIINIIEIGLIFYLFKYEPEYFQKLETLIKYALINNFLITTFWLAHKSLLRKLSK